MRFLPALLVTFLIATPLLAQDPDAERQAEEKRVQEEARAYDERRTEIERVQEMRANLVRLSEELRSKTDATREEAMEAIKRAKATIDDLVPLLEEALRTAERARGAFEIQVAGPTPRTIDLGALGSEVISGSADGTDYTLKSLGDGEYELTATKRDDDGKVMEETKDKGTLKELQVKYSFLQSGLAIQVPAAAAQLRCRVVDRTGRAIAWATQTPLGAASTAWGGGGRVGVNVTEPSEDLRFHLQLPEGAGFIVQQVMPGSRAEEIGIRRMDILLKLDGELIDSPIQLKKLHDNKGVLEIIRRSETRRIDLSTVPEEKAAPAEAPEKDGEATRRSPAGAR